ncbi:3-carboxymuconate cyclase [Candidimonas sp. SYP-B2681]|uniref:lactonase family protein n=1 Tax=Candidimonas sp. SYP-B2681 TaxID=2497686 RepID=UPI000F8937A1|nr:beta-propeller fold lactonase family protein [Candidimonas sp. SYP-B2681]RTZ45484.1 3-carboxymuconate cyclase [Candidimonas sp. SYP-B2681]
MSAGLNLYSAVGSVLTHYRVGVEDASLTKVSVVDMPSRVQYAWRHPLLPILYVTTAASGPRQKSDVNHLSAWALDEDGRLQPLGAPIALPARAVHMCVDPQGRFALNTHNFPESAITVHTLNQDGTLGAQVAQTRRLDYGIYPHQVLAFPSGKAALIIDRGNKATDSRGEEPGALRSFMLNDGSLSEGRTVAPGGGYGFGARHADFHPSKPWMYVSDERFNRLYMFRFNEETIEEAPAYTRVMLADADNVRPRQIAGPIHVHPSGKFVYAANRADQTVELDGHKVFGGGENNIAVYGIDDATGEPTLIQHADTHSFHVRTFACDPTGQLLVAASIRKMTVGSDGGVVTVPAALTVFRITDGRLTFERKYDVEVPDNEMQYWMGMVATAG